MIRCHSARPNDTELGPRNGDLCLFKTLDLAKPPLDRESGREVIIPVDPAGGHCSWGPI